MAGRVLSDNDIGKKFYKKSWLSKTAWPKYFILGRIVEDFMGDEMVYGTTTAKEEVRPPGINCLEVPWSNNSWIEYEEEANTKQEPVLGLSLLEAMESGKEFREIGTLNWFHIDALGYVCWSDGKEMLLNTARCSARYELKPDPKKVEVTESMIREAFYKHNYRHSNLIENVIKELGL